MKYEEGQRVVLPANEDEGWPEQRGVVIGIQDNGMLTVEVDVPYRDEDDDGLREVHPDNVVLEDADRVITIRASQLARLLVLEAAVVAREREGSDSAVDESIGFQDEQLSLLASVGFDDPRTWVENEVALELDRLRVFEVNS